MLIEIEKTLNPNVQNYYFDRPLLGKGESFYADIRSQNKALFFENLFKIGGIKQALLLPDFLFVEKTPNTSFDEIGPQIMAEIVDFDKAQTLKEEHFNVLDKIEALTEAKIRPFLQRDGGNITLLSFEKGILNIKLTGHCNGCPHATQTLKNIVEKNLKQYIPQILEIREEND